MLKTIAITLVAASLLAWPAHADNPGRGKGSQGHNAQSGNTQSGISIDISISTSDRSLIQEYFGNSFRSGRCPPGLAKKNNGCQPPGQAKKWAKGQRLPGDVIYHNLPSDLLGRLRVPAGSKYVRVAADVLLIAAGTGLVLDAIEDLSRL